MNVSKPLHSDEEYKQLGDRYYEDKVLPGLTADDDGKFVAVDIEGRGFEVADDSVSARERLRERIPDAQIWLKRVGYDAAIQFGSHRRAEA